MRRRSGLLLLLMLAFSGHAPSAATSGQSFLYVATPQTSCSISGGPCPPAEILVYDADTLALATRIPLPQDSSRYELAFAPDGTALYAVGSAGTIVVDPQTHTATQLPVVVGGTLGNRYGVVAMRRDGQAMYGVTRSAFGDGVRKLDLTTGAATTFASGHPFWSSVGGVAVSPVADRLFMTNVPPGQFVGVAEYDLNTEQELRRTSGAGPVAVSPDGTRLYTGTIGTAAPNKISVRSTSSLAEIGEFHPFAAAARLYPGRLGRRLYALDGIDSLVGSTRGRVLSVFDVDTLQPQPVFAIELAGSSNVVASDNDARVFVAIIEQTSSTFTGGGVLNVYRNSVVVLDGANGQVIRQLMLPETSLKIPGGDPVFPADDMTALAVTPTGAPRCSYRVGPTQNAWTVEGGSATIALTTPCTWVASSDAPWVHVSQASGSGGATLTLTVDPTTQGPARAATVTIAGQLVTISQAGFGSTPPFGAFDTPGEGSAGHSGSLAATGWALDDAGVVGVRIFRDPVAGEPQGAPVFLGNATLVDGARPDVAAAFPTHPLNGRAGWGLNILTNMLPNQGNGTFRLYAHIDDVEGRTTVLGPRSFMSSNTNVAVPFGAIDTPGQGETVAGTIVNFGWALTQQPNVIPLDGSTIDVLIDGVVVGHPTYGQPRADIAALFPGYQNSNAAVGYFIIDTTQYDNGIHTIAWVVRDNAGNAAGIGSRYFRIQN